MNLAIEAAFKEWAVVIHALAAGEQILILRKGGIHDEQGRFRPEFSRFFLYPTFEHQNAEALNERGRRLLDAVSPPAVDSTVRFSFFAEMTDAVPVRDAAVLTALAGAHIWSPESVNKKFTWGGHTEVWALLVRVFSLPAPVVCPRSDAFSGCRSWIPLTPPAAIETPCQPVLPPSVYNQKRQALRALLPSR